LKGKSRPHPAAVRNEICAERSTSWKRVIYPKEARR
jgi:hypothetical protein